MTITQAQQPALAPSASAPPVWENIPAELRQRPQWVLWKFEAKVGQVKPAKVPYYVQGGRRTGDQGSDKDRARLATLEVARRVFERGGWTGIGFAFLPGDGLIGIDIDGAIDLDTGEVSEQCQAIVQACQSYTEYSPSGKGVHIIVQGETTTNKSNDIGLEVFCGRQFFTFTARRWPDTPTSVEEITPTALARLHATIDEAKARRRASPPPAAAATQPADGGESVAALRARVEPALQAISPDMGYEDWLSIGWALKDSFGEFGFGLWNAWSSAGNTYKGEADLMQHWRSFKGGNKSPGEAVGVIFKRAKEAGYRPPASATKRSSSTRAAVPGAQATVQDHAGADVDDDAGDRGRLKLLRNGSGKPQDCRENVLYCLRLDPLLQGLVAHNQFTELQDKRRPPPWGGDAGEWTEEDDLMLGEYIARKHGVLIKGGGTLRAGVQMAARENKYHPVLDALRAVQWDGIARLDTWLSDCLGAVERPYVALVSRFFILGMVARLLRPGCKFDYMPILQGAQGIGKSTAFRALADPWFMDTPFRIGDKDAYLSLQGIWLVEFSELEAMSKSESTAIKAFMSSQEDRFRPPYGSRMAKMPRRAVLAGTTNSDQFLKDSTGERRFWPVHVSEVRIDLLKAMRAQLFAEALHVLEHQAGTDAARHYPTREEERTLFHPEQDKWRMVDVWTDILADYVNRSHTDKIDEALELAPCKRGFFSSQELFDRALSIKAERMDNGKLMQARVANAMRELGFEYVREPTGSRKRGYLRPGWCFAPGGRLQRVTEPLSAPQAQPSCTVISDGGDGHAAD